MAITGSFEGWRAGLAAATGYALAGPALLFAARRAPDSLAAPGACGGGGAGWAAAPGYALAGPAILFAARWLTDWLLLPGVTIRHEVLEQAVPNVGVGYLEALFYLRLSLLVGWAPG